MPGIMLGAFQNRTVRRASAALALLAVLAPALGGPGPHIEAAAPGAGTLDTTFDKDGKVTTDFGSNLDQINGLAIQPDGKIIAAGESWPKPDASPRFTLARYNKDGSLDKTFDKDGKVITKIVDDAYDYSGARALALQPDGKIVVVGKARNPEIYRESFAVARYNKDGTLDKTFDKDGRVLTQIEKVTGYGPSEEANAVAVQPDGKIVVAGITGVFPKDFALVRYNKNGSLDTGFGEGGIVITDMGGDDTAMSIAIQSDGKIVVGGRGDLEGSDNDFALARYNKDGTLDETFDEDGKVMTDFLGGKDWVYGVIIRPDGKIVAGGLAELACGYYCRRWGFALAQYNKDGSLDTGFADEGKGHYAIDGTTAAYAMARRPDGKLILAGHINNSNFAVAMFDADGSLDGDFAGDGLADTNFGKGTDRVYALALQPDGKIVAGGVGVVDPKDILNGDFALARYNQGSYTPRGRR